MAVNYAIQAEVVDIQADRPRHSDKFLVDTNVWHWLTYPRANQSDKPPSNYQTTKYPSYVGRAHSAKARLLYCGLTLAELSHLIEKTEREIFNRASGLSVGSKEYRHNHVSERINKVVAEVEAAWGLVKTIAQPLDLLVDESTTNAALARLTTQPLDGYDLFILEAIAKAGVTQVITDDGDFAVVPGIQVFTSNRNLITAAQNQGKLLSR